MSFTLSSLISKNLNLFMGIMYAGYCGASSSLHQNCQMPIIFTGKWRAPFLDIRYVIGVFVYFVKSPGAVPKTCVWTSNSLPNEKKGEVKTSSVPLFLLFESKNWVTRLTLTLCINPGCYVLYNRNDRDPCGDTWDIFFSLWHYPELLSSTTIHLTCNNDLCAHCVHPF